MFLLSKCSVSMFSMCVLCNLQINTWGVQCNVQAIYVPHRRPPPQKKNLTAQGNRHARKTHWSFLCPITSHIYWKIFFCPVPPLSKKRCPLHPCFVLQFAIKSCRYILCRKKKHFFGENFHPKKLCLLWNKNKAFFFNLSMRQRQMRGNMRWRLGEEWQPLLPLGHWEEDLDQRRGLLPGEGRPLGLCLLKWNNGLRPCTLEQAEQAPCLAGRQRPWSGRHLEVDRLHSLGVRILGSWNSWQQRGRRALFAYLSGYWQSSGILERCFLQLENRFFV